MRIFGKLSAMAFDRKSVIVALGGGVTGDISGFLASIYLRGIPFIQVPTSMLAMVDSSIGGKTGVDSREGGKNLLGSFYQPEAVIIDMEFLSTLPGTEFINGMAEVIKHALIRDRAYFNFIRDKKSEILSLEPEVLAGLMEKSCRIKVSVVEADERERSLRQILNFGHTLGHSIEKTSNFSIPHGYSLALGMIIESHISFSRKLLSEREFSEIVNLIGSYGLDSYKARLRGFSFGRIIESALSDKKNLKREIKAVLLKRIGEVFEENGSFSFVIGENEIKAGLDYILNGYRL